MEPLIVIEKSSELRDLIHELSKTRYLAMDTESNSFHAYFDRICLIQISTTQQDYILDPIVIEDMSPLGDILANSRIEKIFHAASNDIAGFKRDFNFRIQNLFDTALAAKLLGCDKLGLATILEKHFGVQLNKKWQRCDWSKRPLTRDQLNYARLDTHYLISLRHLLAAELRKRELWEKAQEEFQKACEQEVQERKAFQPENYLSIVGACSLDATGKNILRDLYLYRDKEARRRNRAPFRILSNAILLKLARYQPTHRESLSGIKGLPRPYKKKRAASSLLEIIRRNKEMKTNGNDSSQTAPDHPDTPEESAKGTIQTG